MKKNISIIGLGYVGLPLAIELSNHHNIMGFDINKKRIEELNQNFDITLEVSNELLECSENISFSCDQNDIKNSDIFIVTVPTPINQDKTPNLSLLENASRMISKHLKRNSIVIYESTVYPGCTEEFCVPILEESGLRYNESFFVGYSPERMNPGDSKHSLKNVIKVTSGSNESTARSVDDLYSTIVDAGTHLASSIKIAEAAKVIENSQRDINIAFMNELSIIFEKLDINTNEVLKAASTKWNFLNFKPGLVGGHCIGVDPYYLTSKSQSIGYHPQIILAGRKINDDMGKYIANRTIKEMIKKDLKINKSKILILGITFKENCPDVRNTRVIDIFNELKEYGCDIDVSDPWADPVQVKNNYHIELKDTESALSSVNSYDSIIIAVAHSKFLTIKLETFKGVIFDVKNIMNLEYSYSL